MSTPTVRNIYFTTTEIAELLKNGALSKDETNFKISARSLTCAIDSCRWQGTDNVDLCAHVKVSHNGSSLKAGNQPSQVVLTKFELQELAVHGVKTIRENKFAVVEPVRYLFDFDGGKWFTLAGEKIADISSEQTAREADGFRKIQEASNEKTAQLAKKDEVIKAGQDAKKAIQSQNEELLKKLNDVRSKLKGMIDAKALSEIAAQNLRKDLPDERESSQVVTATPSTAPQGVLPVAANEKDHLNRSSSSAAITVTVNVDELRSQILRLKNDQSTKEPLINDSIALHKRFFVYAMEGMINHWEKAPANYIRSAETQSATKRGNAVAHQANIRAHLAMFKLGQLNPDEIATFQKMYGFHPQKFKNMLVTEKTTLAWDMMGSVAGYLARVKFNSGEPLYKEFLAHAEALNKIRGEIDGQRGNTEEGRSLFDKNGEVNKIIVEMTRLKGVFDARDKAERDRSQ